MFQNKVSRIIVDAPWFIRSKDLHRDLKLQLVSDVLEDQAIKHSHRLRSHENNEIQKLADIVNIMR